MTSKPSLDKTSVLSLNDFSPPHPVQLSGSKLARRLLGLLGWQLAFNGLPARQGVIVVYPHTSNWDFPVGILAKWALGVPLQFWGKDSLFKIPLFGRWLRWVGGIPVVRSSANGLVEQAIADLKQARQDDTFIWVTLAPEGTRRLAPGWRSGFYQIVVGSGVPLGVAHIDFGAKCVKLVDFLTLSGDPDHDMERLSQAYRHTTGKTPANSSPVVLLSVRRPNTRSSHDS
jgi:hypothetical protein